MTIKCSVQRWGHSVHFEFFDDGFDVLNDFKEANYMSNYMSTDKSYRFGLKFIDCPIELNCMATVPNWVLHPHAEIRFSTLFCRLSNHFLAVYPFSIYTNYVSQKP